jgi:hypothetical protein
MKHKLGIKIPEVNSNILKNIEDFYKYFGEILKLNPEKENEFNQGLSNFKFGIAFELLKSSAQN